MSPGAAGIGGRRLARASGRGTLRYTPLHLSARAGGGPRCWPRHGCARPRHRSADADVREAERRRAILAILALGLAFRLIIAYVLLPGSGFGADRTRSSSGRTSSPRTGPAGFYDRGFFIDYTPGYLYVLWLIGIVGNALGGVGDLIKLPAILADVGVAWLVRSMVRELGGSRRAALLGAALVPVQSR